MHTYVYEISRKEIERLKLILLPSICKELDEHIYAEADITKYEEERKPHYDPERQYFYYSTEYTPIRVHINDPEMWYYITSSSNTNNTPEWIILDQILCMIGRCIESL